MVLEWLKDGTVQNQRCANLGEMDNDEKKGWYGLTNVAKIRWIGRQE